MLSCRCRRRFNVVLMAFVAVAAVGSGGGGGDDDDFVVAMTMSSHNTNGLTYSTHTPLLQIEMNTRIQL